MEASSFEKSVCLQFNALMMIVIKGTLSSHRRQSARRSKHEVLFCELSEMKRMENGTNDEYFSDFVSFQVMNFTIRVSDEELGTALQELTEKQRTAILLHFFRGMNDREISELYHVSRSTIRAKEITKIIERKEVERMKKDYAYPSYELICRATSGEEKAVKEILDF